MDGLLDRTGITIDPHPWDTLVQTDMRGRSGNVIRERAGEPEVEDRGWHDHVRDREKTRKTTGVNTST